MPQSVESTNPGMCPDRELNQWPLQVDAQLAGPQGSGLGTVILKQMLWTTPRKHWSNNNLSLTFTLVNKDVELEDSWVPRILNVCFLMAFKTATVPSSIFYQKKLTKIERMTPQALISQLPYLSTLRQFSFICISCPFSHFYYLVSNLLDSIVLFQHFEKIQVFKNHSHHASTSTKNT